MEDKALQDLVNFLAGEVFAEFCSELGGTGFLVFFTNLSILLLSTSGKKKFSLHLSLKLRASTWLTSLDHSGRLLELDIWPARSASPRSWVYPRNLGTCNSASSSF